MGFMDFLKGKKEPPKSAEDIAAEKRAALRSEAMANARAARERMGEDTIQQIAEALQRQSAGKAARDALREMDKAHIADHIKIMLDKEK